MTPRFKILATATVVVVGLAAFSLWFFRDPAPDPTPEPVTADANTAPAGSSSVASAPAAEAKVEPAPVVAAPAEPVADNTAEVAATRRMYMAHAPLRVPEVADPDSESNRRTLQTMVEKALGRAAAEVAPVPASN